MKYVVALLAAAASLVALLGPVHFYWPRKQPKL